MHDDFCCREELGIYWADCAATLHRTSLKNVIFFLTRSLLVIHHDRQQTFVLLWWLLTDFSRSESGVRRSHVRSVCWCPGAHVPLGMPAIAAWSRQIQWRYRIGCFTEISFYMESTFLKTGLPCLPKVVPKRIYQPADSQQKALVVRKVDEKHGEHGSGEVKQWSADISVLGVGRKKLERSRWSD